MRSLSASVPAGRPSPIASQAGVRPRYSWEATTKDEIARPALVRTLWPSGRRFHIPRANRYTLGCTTELWRSPLAIRMQPSRQSPGLASLRAPQCAVWRFSPHQKGLQKMHRPHRQRLPSRPGRAKQRPGQMPISAGVERADIHSLFHFLAKLLKCPRRNRHLDRVWYLGPTLVINERWSNCSIEVLDCPTARSSGLLADFRRPALPGQLL
jgi:hypothetical protein